MTARILLYNERYTYLFASCYDFDTGQCCHPASPRTPLTVSSQQQHNPQSRITKASSLRVFKDNQRYRTTVPVMRSYAFHPVDEPDAVVSQVFHIREWESERNGPAPQVRTSVAIAERSLHSQASSSSIRSIDSTISETTTESSPSSSETPSDSQNKARTLLWKMSLKRSLFSAPQ